MKRIIIFFQSDYYATLHFATEQEAFTAFGELNTDITKRGFGYKLTN